MSRVVERRNRDMWMDAYVQDTLIRQQIAESNRIAALHHLVSAARSPRTTTPWWTAFRRFIGGAAPSWPRRRVSDDGVYWRLFVWASAALSAVASFAGSSLAQKCM